MVHDSHAEILGGEEGVGGFVHFCLCTELMHVVKSGMLPNKTQIIHNKDFYLTLLTN